MNKLKEKVFFVIFILLSLFLITILFTFNYQDYYLQKRNITQNLLKAKKVNDDKNELNYRFNSLKIQSNNKPSVIFMDNPVYNIILDSHNNIVCIINNSNVDLNDEELIKVVYKIIDENSNSRVKVGNLYFSRYSYSYNYGDYITIIDTKNIQNSLIFKLNISIMIFILLEILIFLIAKKITNWITMPILETFDKQKQFIADASHELKTPLSVIIASSEALENDLENKKLIQNIKNESERMNNLIKNLLNLAKMENKDYSILYKNNNISKIIELTSLTYESLMYEENIKLTTNIDSEIILKCNEEQIKELIAILIDNAIKHTFKNGNIIVNLQNNKNNIILEVKNEGDPIPKDKEEKIFERFYRLDESRNRNENRYGLGLAIAKSIVLNHNGTICASSSNGYTTFKIKFNKNL